jgi:ABC-2 type transport system ATP-binding protein
MTAAYAIDVSGLTKRFGKKTVVDNFDIQVPRGEVWGFLGPNGSGKTTTIRMLCGLLRPDAGQGNCLGYDVLRQSAEIKAHVGYMTQKFSFYEDLSIRENLEFVARLYAMPEMGKSIDAALDHLGLTHRQRQLAGQLSGGWKQRLALAACILHRPALLLLDEPTAGVDPQARRDFWEQIHDLAGQGITVLVSTHYMDEAERCDRIVYLAYGQTLARGTIEEVIAQAGLHAYLVSGGDIRGLAAALRGKPGITQVSIFGTSLHVCGTDKAALDAAIQPFRSWPGANWTATTATLEDVFIHLMAPFRERGQG